ncbi:aminoglycoside phosphotransferase family protein [Entomomonas asaccharolytica]|uniref:Phosphotransferase n=1 Tax=Entomomonas asaccharolytica TaxID=2785331 RepID=A0A974RXT6_9GAMM|nr:phosphotransferase [Entomomonas asaccharolytica]QQP86525.1 phosphotransferase [Entomomonas asaccharolytica]
MNNDLRLVQLISWLSSLSLDLPFFKGKLNEDDILLKAASSDASFRRYFRLYLNNQSLIVMDAPPPQENKNCLPFIKVAGLLANQGLNVPQILAADLEQGFLLLSDLGTQTWLEILTEQNADKLFPLAIDSLIKLQQAPLSAELPEYNEALLQRELLLFPEWYLNKHCNIVFTETQQLLWEKICKKLIESALQQPKVLVHRDYMPRNLMLSNINPGVLDFQDAVYGPITYDITCLFKDAFISWPQAKVQQWLLQYWQQAKQNGISIQDNFEDFLLVSDLMGVQRHLKVIGIFARIMHRDNKPRYVKDVPRFFNYINEVIQRRPELNDLQELLKQLSLPENKQ